MHKEIEYGAIPNELAPTGHPVQMASDGVYDDIPVGEFGSYRWVDYELSFFPCLFGDAERIGGGGTTPSVESPVQMKGSEADPNGLDAKTPGAKLDAGKSPIFQGLLDYFPRACLMVADVSAVGAKKYSWKGWEKVPDGPNRYANALVRHIAKEAVEGPIDSETGLLHAAQEAWNALARLELILREKEPSHIG